MLSSVINSTQPGQIVQMLMLALLCTDGKPFYNSHQSSLARLQEAFQVKHQLSSFETARCMTEKTTCPMEENLYQQQFQETHFFVCLSRLRADRWTDRQYKIIPVCWPAYAGYAKSTTPVMDLLVNTVVNSKRKSIREKSKQKLNF